MPIFFAGDSNWNNIHLQCLIFYEDYNVYVKAYLEFKLSALLQRI